ncbi:hypothetical protein QJQ45_009505 [Haematococcus lacustris]|nr:hypothetical protein QJQ45_009505 [Haematococcus lacustris]
MRTLLIDNYDSYTYNLYQLLCLVDGEAPLVASNDNLTLADVQEHLDHGEVHSIVISPGPGNPHTSRDVGVCLDVLQHLQDVPVLGVCLGHQALAVAAGGRVVPAPEPVHGRLSTLQHSGHPLFTSIPSGTGFSVVRYHSLVVQQQGLPSDLQVISWTQGTHHAVDLASSPAASSDQSARQPRQHCSPLDPKEHRDHDASALLGQRQQQQQRQVEQQLEQQQQQLEQQRQHGCIGAGDLIMALAHRRRPHYGVQFHPELQQGLLRTPRPPAIPRTPASPGAASGAPSSHCSCEPSPPGPSLSLLWCKVPGLLRTPHLDTQLLFTNLVGWGPDSFWLDSATPDRGRFSYMAGRGGPLWRRITYRLPPPPSQPPGTLSPASPDLQQDSRPTGHTPGSPPGLDFPAAPLLQPQLPYLGGGCVHTATKACGPCKQSHTPCGWVTLEDQHGHTECWQTPFFLFLKNLVAELRLPQASTAADQGQLPFDFQGGLVGYLGYELKAECGGEAAHPSPTPDAALLLADRLMVTDQVTGDVYLLALFHPAGLAGSPGPPSGAHPALCPPRVMSGSCIAADPGKSEAGKGEHRGGRRQQQQQHGVGQVEELSQAWLLQPGAQPVDAAPQPGSWASDGSPARLMAVEWVRLQLHMVRDFAARLVKEEGAPPAAAHDDSPAQTWPEGQLPAPTPFRLRHARQQYLANIAASDKALHRGDSYEVCLTTALVRQQAPDPACLYRTLRAVNPAPYAAWLSFGACGPVVCCSSPERFLKGSPGGWLEARPIKGTAPRHLLDPVADAAAAADLAASEKDRAENLMIVDLLRNDLGRVCKAGSVHVPGLMEVESYATVHQMVSTVRGQRRPELDLVDCIQAAFPGGSMTGAPKVRTMAIIDELEGCARGVYSGSLGYISLNDTFDLNIVIRTAVIYESPQDPVPHTLTSNVISNDSKLSVAAAWWKRATVSIGAGGAIVVQSDAEAEYEEMRLKARALLAAVGKCDGGAAPAQVDDTIAHTSKLT